MKHWLINIILATLAVFAPIQSLMLATGAVIILDLITGVVRAWKKKERIKSSIMRRTVTKFFVFQIAIISGYFIETYISPGLPMTKIISSVIGLVEAKSIMENLNDIYGGDIFKMLIKRLGSDNDNTDQ